MHEIEGIKKLASCGLVIECDLLELCYQFGRRSGVQRLVGQTILVDGAMYDVTSVGKEFKRGRQEFVYLHVDYASSPVAR